MATQALRVLAHVAALGAGLWRWQKVREAAFLATQWGLQQMAVAIVPRADTQECFTCAQRGGAHGLVQVALPETSLQATGEVGRGGAGVEMGEGAPGAPFAEATVWGRHFEAAVPRRPGNRLP